MKRIDALVFMVAVVAIAVVLNVIAVQPNAPSLRIDLTQNQRYTLSDATTSLLTNLNEPVVVRVFLSENLHYPDHNLHERLDDLLSEYEIASEGKLSFEIVHPSEEGENSADPSGFGIRKIPVGSRGQDEVAVRLVYQGVAFVQGDRQEVIPEIRGHDNLEYELTKHLKLVTTPHAQRRRVGFLKGFGGPADQPHFLPSIQQAFSRIYGQLIVVELVEIKDKQAVPPHIDALILLNPSQRFDPQTLLAIDQFLMSGHGLGWFQDGLQANPQLPKHPERQPLITGLNALFESYGIHHRSDLVLDRSSNIVSSLFAEGAQVQVANPTMPLLTDIDRSSSITRDVPQLVFPLTSSLEGPPDTSGLDVHHLVRTSRQAVRRANNFDISHESVSVPDASETPGPFTVALGVQGEFSSHFADKLPSTPSTFQAKSSGAARLLVTGSGSFMFPQPGQGYDSNYAGLGALFLINSVDWLVQDEGLAAIRGKGVPQVARVADQTERLRYQLINILAVPGAVVLLGLMAFLYRRRRRNMLAI